MYYHNSNDQAAEWYCIYLLFCQIQIINSRHLPTYLGTVFLTIFLFRYFELQYCIVGHWTLIIYVLEVLYSVA